MELDTVIEHMRRVFADLPPGVDHTLRVLENARNIGLGERLDKATADIVALAAVLHDIGAIAALEKHGSIDGRFQEIEGPNVARSILEAQGVEPQVVDRVCYIVGNHHTRDQVDGTDFEVLWDADALDELEHGEARNAESLWRFVDERFVTGTGRRLALERAGLAS